jgi:hypothetical protein
MAKKLKTNFGIPSKSITITKKQEKSKTIVHSLVKGGLGAIPIIGSLAVEVFGLLVTPPLEKRRAEWMNEIAQKLIDLEIKQQINFEELQHNDQFIDVVLQATTYALKTSEKDKINAFQNAIMNTAVGETPGETISQIFLNQLDSFTVWHIKILKFIDDPRLWFQRANITPPDYISGSLASVLFDAFPELRSQHDMVQIIWNDLRSAGLHSTGDLNTIMSSAGMMSGRTTSLGKKFLKYISDYGK